MWFYLQIIKELLSIFFPLTKKAIKGICHYSARPARAVSNQHQITFILLLINRCFTCRVKKSFFKLIQINIRKKRLLKNQIIKSMIKRMPFKSVPPKKGPGKLIYTCINSNSFKVTYHEQTLHAEIPHSSDWLVWK